LGIKRTENVRQLADLYSAADVFLNPTFEDTFPTTNLESLACGTPVITYNTGGSVESVSSNTGFIVDKGNIPSLKSSILEIISRGKGYYTDICRETAEKYFDKKIKFNEYLKLYNELINK
jgi:glycosyltransferase involved in cell wall biosynthesis